MANVGFIGRLYRREYVVGALAILVATIVSLIFLSPTVGAGSQLLMNSFGPEASGALNVPYRSNTVLFNYTGGTVTFTACSNQACAWAIDDAARLVVTRPGGSQMTRDFVSDTKDKPAQNVTDMFLAGVNTVTIQMIDRFAPQRGLPRPLYLVESTGSLPTPAPAVVSLPVNKKFNNGPYNLNSVDPVNTYTGSFLYAHTDIAIGGRGPGLVFSRSYDSSDTLTGALGQGWTHSYAMQLVRPDEITNDIVVIGAQGRADRFTFNSGSYTAPAGIYTSLAKNGNGTYTVTHKDLTTWSFDEAGKLTRISDRFGNQSVLSYETSGRLASIGDAAGRGSLVVGYDGSGRISSLTDWTGRVVQYGYDGSGRLGTVTDRQSSATAYGYDGSSSRVATIRDARNNVVVTNTYDAQGRVATQKDARGLVNGQQTSFAYNTNADGTKTTVITYPKTSFEPTWSFVEEDTYDAQGRIIKKVSKPVANSAEWITEEYTYDGSGNRATFKDGRGNKTTYCYDVDYAGAAVAGSRGNLTRLIAPAPVAGTNLPVTLQKYDNKSNLTQMVSPKGVASGTSVTCTTNLALSVNLNFATDFTYDSATQTKLVTTTSRYTEPGVGAKTARTKYEYNDASNPGSVTKIISPRGNTGASPDYSFATTNTYFGAGAKAGMLESVTIPSGAVTKYDYDAVGRKIAMTGPKGNVSGAVAADHTWQYVYDNEDRLRFSKAPAPVAGGAQLVTETRYDAVGNKVVAIDAKGQVTRYVYDERDSLQEVHQSPNAWSDPAVNPAGLITTNYQYDHLGNLTRMTRAKGDSTYERATDFAFDGRSRVRREIQYPSWPTVTPSLVTLYTYDKNSNQISLRDPLLKTTNYVYDALNRQTNITYNSTTTPNVTYTYDFNNNRTKMVDGTGTTNYTYDELDRMLSAQSPGPKTVGYRYDLDGNRVKVIYSDNTAVTYTFDKSSRMESLADWSNRVTSYAYFADGKVQTQNNQMNGTSTHYTYDNAGRLTQVWNKLGDDTVTRHTYQMDAVGNRTQADEVLTDGYDPGPIVPDNQGTVGYTYDRLNRLTQEDRQLPYPQDEEVLTYTYDPLGNRLSERIFDGTFTEATQFSHDKADRLVVATGEEDEEYTVDANGNMTRRGWSNGITFTYDQANRMTRSGGGNTRYTYDGDGNRTKIQQGTFTLTTKDTYLYDVNRDLPVLLQDMKNKYVWGLDLAYVVNATNAPGVYHFDGVGSMRAITDVRTPDRPRVEMYEEYRAFGEEGYSNRLYEQPFKFTGEQKDEYNDAAFLYLRSRYYDPSIGRFMTRDSYAGDTMNPQSLNRYSYVQNNPVNFTDPSGEIECGQTCLGVAGMVGGTGMVVGGVAVLLGTGVTGVGAVGGFAIMSAGFMGIGAGGAAIIADARGTTADDRGPISMVTQGVTSNSDAHRVAEVADTVFPGGGTSKMAKLQKFYTWLRTAELAGVPKDAIELYRLYERYGFSNGPQPAYSPKPSK